MSTEPLGQQILDSADSSSFLSHIVHEEVVRFDQMPSVKRRVVHRSSALQSDEFTAWSSPNLGAHAAVTFDPFLKGISPWSRSLAKRIFDCACVVLALPVLVPLVFIVAAAVRLTSSGPVLFLQERMGRHGKPFTILKFRTMVHISDKAHHPITTSDNQRFTPIGPFLRRWKLDELPQLANVLLGHMSLVGPRPKLQEHVTFDLPCRPGITGMATTIFACEEIVLARVPTNRLDAFYHAVVLPAKRKLDAEYMAQASFVSDLRLLVKSVLRRWDTAAFDSFIIAAAIDLENDLIASRETEAPRTIARRPIPASAARPAGVEQVSAF